MKSTAHRVARKAIMYAATALISISAAQGIAHAEDAAQHYQFNIPSENLVTALKAFALTSGQQFAYDSDALANVQSHALQGNLTIDTALSNLLSGTGLSAESLPGGVIKISRDPAPATISKPQAENGSEDGVEQIVVVARKKSEVAARTPLAVSAMTGTDMKRKGVNTFDDLAMIAPNVVVDRGNGQQGVNIALRGVQDNKQGLTQTPGVAVILDGVQQFDTRALIIPFFDVDHIEVLRGPQGTLYGAASPGGVVNVISKRPTFDFGGSADLEFGNFNTRRANFVLNTPITDTLAMRFALNSNDRDGYIIQAKTVDGHGSANVGADGGAKLNGEHDYSGRLSVLYKPSEDTSWLIQATGQHSYDSDYGTILYDTLVAHANGGEKQRTAPASPIAPSTNDNVYTLNSDFNTRLGGIDLQFLTGISHITYDDILIDNGGIMPPGGPGWIWVPYYGHNTTYSSELRLHNAQPDKLDWVLGASFLQLDSDSLSASMASPCLNTVDGACMSGDAGDLNPSADQSLVNTASTTDITRRSASLYGTLQYHLSDTLELTAGGRVSSDKISQHALTYKFITYGSTGAFGEAGSTFYGDPCNFTNLKTDLCAGTANYQSASYADAESGSYGDSELNQTYDATKFTWKLGIDWKPNPATMWYANISTGYKPGGFNAPTGFVDTPCCYTAENLVAYEVGYKGRPTSWLWLDSDVYYYRYDDMQVISTIEIGNANFASVTINTPTTIYGMETQATFTPTHNDSITVSLNYLHATFDELQSGGNAGNPVIDWSDHVMDKAPTTTASLNWRHRWDLANGANLAFNAATQYTATYYLNVISNSQTYRQAPFTRSGLDLTYTAPNGRLTVQAYVKNIEDKVQETFYQGNPFQPGNGNVGISEPRQFGLRLGTTF